MPHRAARRLGAALLPRLPLLPLLAACDGERLVDDTPPPVLSVEPRQLGLVTGSTTSARLTAEGSGAERARVTWESRAPEVFTVSASAPDGSLATIAGVSVGSGVLQAHVEIGRRQWRVDVPVTVTTAPCLLVGPSIGPQTSTLAPGETVRLRILSGGGCSAPGDTLASWRSLDTLVALVDSTGLVTGRAPGVATIRAALLRAPNLVAVATVTVRGVP